MLTNRQALPDGLPWYNYPTLSPEELAEELSEFTPNPTPYDEGYTDGLAGNDGGIRYPQTDNSDALYCEGYYDGTRARRRHTVPQVPPTPVQRQQTHNPEPGLREFYSPEEITEFERQQTTIKTLAEQTKQLLPLTCSLDSLLTWNQLSDESRTTAVNAANRAELLAQDLSFLQDSLKKGTR